MKVTRREFLQAIPVLAGAVNIRSASANEKSGRRVMTVNGAIEAEKLGVTLVHEHVLVDFIGADRVSRDRYDADEAFRVALPYLRKVHERGCRTLIECTPAYLGRDPSLLKRLSQASGMHLLTNTGYYGAAKDKFVPAHAFKETPGQLARRWIGEWRGGIDGTGIKPGFIKIGVDAGPLSDIDRKLVQAAARTHLETGLTIAAHTDDGTAAREELEVIREEGLDESAFIWVHAQKEKNFDLLAQAAERGAWIELDKIGPKTIEQHLEAVKAMKQHGYLNRVLLSHDAGWYHVGGPGGGRFRSYDTLFTEFIPALKKAGFSDAEIHRMTVENPQEAFAIQVRAKT